MEHTSEALNRLSVPQDSPDAIPLPVEIRRQILTFWDCPDPEQTFLKSAQVVDGLSQWAAAYPPLRQVRILPLALSVTIAAPFCSTAALISTAKVSLCVFALDDLFDEADLTIEQFQERAGTYKAIIGGGRQPAASDSLAEALAAVQLELAEYSLYPALGQHWVAATQGTIDGMVREIEWRQQYHKQGAAMLPMYEAYLATGRYSIGGPPHIFAALITINDLSTIDCLPYLQEMERSASTCIRLANDLQSHAREMEEGKFNALDILSRVLQKQGKTEAESINQAESKIRTDISSGLRKLKVMAAHPRTHSGKPELAIAQIAQFVYQFYNRHDFHTFSTE